MRVVNNYYADLCVSAGQVDYVHADCPPSSLLVPYNVYADAFFPVSGFSMTPTICEGDVIGVKELDCFERIDSSKIYVVITRDGERMVKRIVPPENLSDIM
jgi:phage repressor protein C with HTH and peptisase S24 domain